MGDGYPPAFVLGYTPACRHLGLVPQGAPLTIGSVGYTMAQMQAWQTEVLRVSLLGVAPGERLTVESLTGLQPASTTSRPAQGFHLEEVVWNGSQLVVSEQPGRVDVNWVAVPSHIGPPSVGEFFDVLEKFEGLFFGKKLPSAQRIAFGGSLHKSVGGLEESLGLLRVYIPDLNVDGLVGDLIYQVNRAKEVSGVRVNRLAKWSQANFHAIQFGASPQLSAVETFFVKLDLDLNTGIGDAFSDVSKYPEMLRVFFSEARILSESGDVR